MLTGGRSEPELIVTVDVRVLQAGLKAANDAKAQLSADLEEEAARGAQLQKVLRAEEELSAQLEAQLEAATVRGDDLEGKLTDTQVRAAC